jgi:hypothetical protein
MVVSNLDALMIFLHFVIDSDEKTCTPIYMTDKNLHFNFNTILHTIDLNYFYFKLFSTSYMYLFQ